MSLPAAVQAALDAFSSALAAALGGTAPAAPAGPVKWYRPTATQSMAFATRIGWAVSDLDGNRQANSTAVSPKIPACDGTPADAMTFAAFGFQPDGIRYRWNPTDRENARAMCDALYLAASPAAANLIVQGAGDPGVTNDLDYCLVMTGAVSGGGLLGTPSVNAGAFQTVDAWVAYWMSATPPGPNAPGPGVA